jgi:DNA polymerase-1
LNSRQQIGKFLKEQVLTDADYANWPKTDKAKQMDMSRNTLRQASYRSQYPISRWMAALMVLNVYNKLLSTYGENLLELQDKHDRIKYRINVAAAITGRASSSSINIQNIPKAPTIRRSFVADPAFPTGGVGVKQCLVMADYSSVEVRVLASISGDAALMHECIYGDVHAASAADRLKMPAAEFRSILKDKTNPLQPAYKALRGKAKAITFSVCYGSGIANLALGLKCSDEEAAKAMEGWALRYPKAFAFRQVMYEKLMQTGFLHMADGRSVFVFKGERTLPVASNYGIQGSAASVMYRALFHVQRLLDDSGIACRMAATVHDEIILRSHIDCSERAYSILGQGMERGWEDVFPGTDTTNLFDGGIGFSWADKS